MRVKEKDKDVKELSYRPCVWVPGCFLDGTVGPKHRASVMLIGKMPGREDSSRGRCFAGEIGRFVKNIISEFGIPSYDVYCTNTVRYQIPGTGTIRSSTFQTCLPVLAQEIALVKPKVIILLGADAAKHVAGMKLTDMRAGMFHMLSENEIGKVSPGIGQGDRSICVAGTINPGQILRESGLLDGFKADMQMALSLSDPVKHQSVPLDYRYIYNPVDLKAMVDELIAGGFKCFAIDCEWGGEPFRGGVLRTFQVSWDVGKAFVGVLRKQGELISQTNESLMLAELRRLLNQEGVEIWGHNLRADALWLEDRGVQVMDKCLKDSMLSDHILCENGEHGLEACVSRYTDMGRYDLDLALWKNKHSKLVAERGYLDVPDNILLPYAAADADAVFRLMLYYQKQLALPENAGPANCFYNVVMPCCKPLHEVEKTGLYVDQERMKDMIHKYSAKVDELVEEIRVLINNPDFNPRSTDQVQRLLFDPKHLGGLGLIPVKTTGKYSRPWAEALARSRPEERESLTPSVDSDVIEELSKAHPVVAKLRDFRLIDQVKKTFLTPPEAFDSSGNGIYKKGFMSYIDDDGRIRTTLSQMSETGRHKSSSPNLQNISSRQEKPVQRVMGGSVPGIRSCFMAGPEDILVETDYQSAEIFTLGYLSGCDKLLRDAEGDLHSRGAVERFGAPKWDGYDEYKQPPEEWKDKYKSLRISSKSVVFGIFYQRGPRSIAAQISSDTGGTVECTMEMAAEYIEKFYEAYPEVKMYVDYCKRCVLAPAYIENPFGRRRRFTVTGDEELIAAQQRECVNFCIQSTVADALNTSLTNFYYWRQIYPGEAEYKILLPVHDAVFLACKPKYVEKIVKDVIPSCMTGATVIPSWHPDDGRPPRKEFRLNADVSFGLRWSEKAKPEELIALGVDAKLIKRKG